MKVQDCYFKVYSPPSRLLAEGDTPPTGGGRSSLGGVMSDCLASAAAVRLAAASAFAARASGQYSEV